MSFFCTLLGHTWMPETSAPDPHWHTTKKGDVLESSGTEGEVRYLDRCVRCGKTRDVPAPAAAKREAGRTAG
jgi:hypothetical protein